MFINKMDISNVLLQTLVLGFVSILITWIRTKRIVSAALAYWFGWAFLLFGSWIALNNYWIVNIDSRSLYFILQLHYGAFIGFSLGSLFTSQKNNQKSFEKLYYYVNKIINKISRKILLLLFFIGTIFLIERILTVGLNLNYLSNVREVYNHREDSLIARIGSQVSVIVNFIIIMLAVKDSKEEINFKLLLLTILAASPLGLANGGRIFLLNYIILYFASLVLCRDSYKNNRFLLSTKEWRNFGILIGSVLFIFAIMGYLRGGYGSSFNMFYTILIWPVSTMGAMGSWISSALHGQQTHGLNTFGWLADFLNRLGLMNFSLEKMRMQSVVDYFNSIQNSASSVPRSIIPDLIFDFGKNGVFWGMIFISWILQYATLSFSRKGIFYHTFATISLVGAFMTIQGSVLTPGVSATLFWGAVFSILIRGKII